MHTLSTAPGTKWAFNKYLLDVIVKPENNQEILSNFINISKMNK